MFAQKSMLNSEGRGQVHEVILDCDNHGMQLPLALFLQVLPGLLHATIVLDPPIVCLMTAAHATLEFVHRWFVKVV